MFNEQEYGMCVCVRAQSLSHVQLFVAPWTVACQPPLPMDFSRQEYWRGIPFPPRGDLPDPGIKPTSLESCLLAGGFFTTGTFSVLTMLYKNLKTISCIV